MEANQRVREHKNPSQQERFKQVIQQTLEERKLNKLKVELQAKMEPQSGEKYQA